MSHPNLIADAADALAFAMGGKARFTLVSKKTGERKTFQLGRPGDDKDSVMRFAGLLAGPDNTTDYQYIGFTKSDGSVAGLIAGKKGNPNHPAFKALDWTLRKLAAGEMPEQLEFWHEGRCACCGRALTDPASIERGVGPECLKKYMGAA